jgi:flagellar biosynthesis/type III secretory pathway ATPase
MIERINAYLRQDIGETVSLAESVAQLNSLFGPAA